METYHPNKLEGIIRNLTNESTFFGQECYFYLNATKVIVQERIYSSLAEGAWVQVSGNWIVFGELFEASTIKILTLPQINPYTNQPAVLPNKHHEETILISDERRWTFFHFMVLAVIIFIILNFLSTS